MERQATLATKASQIPHRRECARETVLDKEPFGYEVGDDIVVGCGGGEGANDEVRSSLG